MQRFNPKLSSSATLVLLAVTLAFCADAQAVTMAWSYVGNAGNANDPATGNVFGGVGYNYYIGTYDVTNNQYVAFLNAKVPLGEVADPLGLYNSNMSSAPYGGINFNPLAATGSKYSVISGDGNHPVNFVTFYDALRFANWLNNGQGNGDTETGAYTLLGGTPTPTNGITRNAGATIVVPSENEWYKAAYYDPRTTAQGGPPADSHYWQFPTSTNNIPTASGPTATPNSANFYTGGPDGLTNVGAYSGTTSPYGAFDMGGNVFQWNETPISSSSQGLRGGAFKSIYSALFSSFRIGDVFPTSMDAELGFRVALIPEPSAGVLAVLACGLVWVLRKRFE